MVLTLLTTCKRTANVMREEDTSSLASPDAFAFELDVSWRWLTKAG